MDGKHGIRKYRSESNIPDLEQDIRQRQEINEAVSDQLGRQSSVQELGNQFWVLWALSTTKQNMMMKQQSSPADIKKDTLVLPTQSYLTDFQPTGINERISKSDNISALTHTGISMSDVEMEFQDRVMQSISSQIDVNL